MKTKFKTTLNPNILLEISFGQFPKSNEYMLGFRFLVWSWDKHTNPRRLFLGSNEMDNLYSMVEDQIIGDCS
jgi:hypothetical protein